jgi:signal transduction histidine kinase/CheY-like chemotaxis protein
MISAGMAPQTFAQMLEGQRLPKGWVGTVYDRQMVIVARTRFPERFVGRSAGPIMADAARRAPAGFLDTTNQEDVPTYVAFHRASMTGWTVALGMPKAAVDAPLRRSLWLVAAAGIAFATAGVGLAVVFARRIARPIGALVMSARAIQHGRPAAVPAPSIRELDDLHRALDHAGRAAMRLGAEYEATRILADATSLDDAVDRLLPAIGSAIGWDVGAYWMPSADASVLECRAFWQRDGVSAASFEQASRTRRFELGVGFPGRVWTLRHPAWVEITPEVENFPRLKAALADGLRSGLGIPIALGANTYAVLEFFTRTREPRDAEMLAMAEALGAQIGQYAGRLAAAEEAAARRVAAEEAARRSRFLAEASERLAGSLDYEQTIPPVLRAALPLLGDWGEAHIALSGGAFRRIGPVCIDPAVEPIAREVERVQPTEGWRSREVSPRQRLAAGQTVVVPDVSPEWIEANVAPGAYARALRAARPRAMLLAPFVVRGRTMGSLLFLRTRGASYDAEDVELAADLARRAAAAIDNARLHERANAARQEAELANRMKDEFLATLSHELRTPLTSILGWLRMLQDGTLSREHADRALTVIDRNARALAQLIEDLLDVSRIVTGKLRLNVTGVNPVTVIAAAIETLRPAADAKRLRIEAALDPEAGQIRGDAERLQQVVWNLLSNAIKFTPSGGRVAVGLRRADAHVAIEVADTGRGIAPEVLPFIFERFRQADSTSTRAHGGLGIGLALVRHLVEMHGGSVTAASPGENQGATFTVTLPCAEPSPGDGLRSAAAPGARVGLADGGPLDGVRVLIVDDDRDALDLLGTILVHQGAEVRLVSSVRGARDVVATWAPHVVVSDIEMPGEDGYSLVRWLRSLPAEDGAGVPAIAVTAHTGPEDRVRVLASGFTLHIAKPVEPEELTMAVASVVRRLPPRP